MKTNSQWYFFSEQGYEGYFKLENGTLMGCPVNDDGSRKDEPEEMDWYECWDNDFNPSLIVKQLEQKD